MYKFLKKILRSFEDFISSIQITLVFLAFFTILYWILKLANVTFIQPVVPFFEGINNIVHLFYNRQIQYGEGTVIDFSFFIAAVFMLIFAWICPFIREFIKSIENKIDRFYFYLKHKREVDFNKTLEKHQVDQEKKIMDYLVLLQFKCQKRGSDFYGNRKDVKEQEADMKIEILNRIMFEFGDIFSEAPINNNSGTFLRFNDFDDVDNVLINLKNTLKLLADEYLEKNWFVEFYVGVDILSYENEMNIVQKQLVKLCELKIPNEIVTMATFCIRYELVENPLHVVKPLGIYKIEGVEEQIYEIKQVK